MKLHEFFSCKELHTRRAVSVHLCICGAEWNAFWINEVHARPITPLRNKKSRSILPRLPLLTAHGHRLPVIEPSYLIEQPQHLGVLIVTLMPQQDKGELQLLIERFRQGQWSGDQIGMIFRCMSGAIRGGDRDQIVVGLGCDVQ